MKKNILYLRTDMHHDELISGGSVGHTLGVLQGLVALGNHVVVASSVMVNLLKSQAYPAYPLYFPPLFCLLRWRLAYMRWGLERLCSTLLFTWQTHTLIRRHAINLIYQRYSIFNFTGVMLSKLYGVPLVLEYNGSEVTVFSIWTTDKRWPTFKRLGTAIERLNIRHAHIIVVVSEVIKDDLTAAGVPPSKIIVAPNGVNTTTFDPERLSPMREKIRANYDVIDKFVYGFVGTFSFWHGIETLGTIIPQIIARNPHTHFLLIGDGPLKEKLTATLTTAGVTPHHVTFTGRVTQAEACNYLAACDAFLTPTQPNADGSRFFGSPTKLFEYLSMGKPVIASHLEQLADVVRPAILVTENHIVRDTGVPIGYLIKPTDAQGFIKAACHLADLDAPTRQSMGKAARSKALREHSWEHHVQLIMQHVENPTI